MNIIDIALLALLSVSVLLGIYRRAVASLLGLFACLLSFLLAFVLGPALASWLSGNKGLTDMLASYTDASSLVGDYSLASMQVSGMSTSALEAVLKSVELPESISFLLRQYLSSAAFSVSNVFTVNDYVASTLVTVILQSGSFVLCFFACFLALHTFITLSDHVLHFPMLRLFDGLAAAVFGFLRGVLVLYVLFLLVPVLDTVIPLDMLRNYLGKSALSPLFESTGFFLRVVTGG